MNIQPVLWAGQISDIILKLSCQYKFLIVCFSKAV